MASVPQEDGNPKMYPPSNNVYEAKLNRTEKGEIDPQLLILLVTSTPSVNN